MSLFNSWVENKIEFENNIELIRILAEGVRRAFARADYSDENLYPTRAVAQGDLVLTSASDFLKSKPTEDLRVNDFNFMVISPGTMMGDSIRVIASNNLKGKEIPKEDLVDVTKAFMYDPELKTHPHMRIWVHIKPTSTRQAEMLAKRHAQFSQNVPLSVKRDQEEQERHLSHIKTLQSLGAPVDAVKKALNRRADQLRAQSPSALRLRPDNIRPDDWDARVQKASSSEQPKNFTDDDFRRMIQSKL